MHERGKSQVEMSKLVKCSQCAVQYAIKRFTETQSHVNKTRTGRKLVTTKRQDRKLIQESVSDRKKISSELPAALSEDIGQTISARMARKQKEETLGVGSSTSSFYGRELVKCSVV